MQCPVCITKRCTSVDLEMDLKASHCKTCGGHWISRHNYTRWLQKHGNSVPETAPSGLELEIGDVQKAKLCPDCNKILLKFRVGHGLDFFMDRCSDCGGIWLDKNEWGALHNNNLHYEIRNVFSASWQGKIRSDAIVRALDQVYANRLGPVDYEKVKDIRRWLNDHPQRKALISFLLDENPYKL